MRKGHEPSLCSAGSLSLLAIGLAAQASVFNLYSNPLEQIGNMTDSSPTMGLVFQISPTPTEATAFRVTRLGVYDSGGDGIASSVAVTLFDHYAGTALATTTISAGEGAREDGFVYKDMAQTLDLQSGFVGIIAAWGFSASDPGYDSGFVNGEQACQFNGSPDISAVGDSPFAFGQGLTQRSTTGFPSATGLGR